MSERSLRVETGNGDVLYIPKLIETYELMSVVATNLSSVVVSLRE